VRRENAWDANETERIVTIAKWAQKDIPQRVGKNSFGVMSEKTRGRRKARPTQEAQRVVRAQTELRSRRNNGGRVRHNT